MKKKETKIKETDELIPIIVLSAHSEKEKLLKAIDLGINKYFIKLIKNKKEDFT